MPLVPVWCHQEKPGSRWNRKKRIPAMASDRQAARVSQTLPQAEVCSCTVRTLTKEENEDTWLRFLSRSADLVPLDPAAALDPGSAGMLSDEPFAGPGYRYILSHRSGSDGFFIARARRV